MTAEYMSAEWMWAIAIIVLGVRLRHDQNPPPKACPATTDRCRNQAGL
jgi:hypothetical protein